MSIAAQDLIGCATACANGDEAHCRSAVSRSYYGAYHDTLGWMQAQGMSPAGAAAGMGTHAALFDQLGSRSPLNAQDRIAIRRARLLKVLHQKRIVADYRLSHDVSKAQATQAVRDAVAIMNIR